jgi:ABC-type phosphate transport system substrate-binding protein
MFAVCAAALMHATPAQAQARERSVAVIVHAANPTGAMSTDKVSQIFLKREKSWPSGAAIAPVDREGSSSLRSSFARTFHDRSISALDNYWQQQIFSGRDAPPPVAESDAAVIEYVARNPNAIGYVSDGTDLPASVRVLQVRAR